MHVRCDRSGVACFTQVVGCTECVEDRRDEGEHIGCGGVGEWICNGQVWFGRVVGAGTGQRAITKSGRNGRDVDFMDVLEFGPCLIADNLGAGYGVTGRLELILIDVAGGVEFVDAFKPGPSGGEFEFTEVEFGTGVGDSVIVGGLSLGALRGFGTLGSGVFSDLREDGADDVDRARRAVDDEQVGFGVEVHGGVGGIAFFAVGTGESVLNFKGRFDRGQEAPAGAVDEFGDYHWWAEVWVVGRDEVADREDFDGRAGGGSHAGGGGRVETLIDDGETGKVLGVLLEGIDLEGVLGVLTEGGFDGVHGGLDADGFEGDGGHGDAGGVGGDNDVQGGILGSCGGLDGGDIVGDGAAWELDTELGHGLGA